MIACWLIGSVVFYSTSRVSRRADPSVGRIQQPGQSNVWMMGSLLWWRKSTCSTRVRTKKRTNHRELGRQKWNLSDKSANIEASRMSKNRADSAPILERIGQDGRKSVSPSEGIIRNSVGEPRTTAVQDTDIILAAFSKRERI